MKEKFKNAENAQKFVESELSKKYGETFIYEPKESKNKFKKYPMKSVFVGIFHLKEEPEKQILVWADSFGEMKDDYAQYYFKDEAEQQVKDLLKNQSMVQSMDITFEAGETSEKLDGSIPLQDYIEKTNSSYRIELSFPEGLTDNEYAEEIKKIYEILGTKLTNYNFQVDVNGKTIYFETITSEMKEIEIADIIYGMESERRINKLNKLEKDGKK